MELKAVNADRLFCHIPQVRSHPALRKHSCPLHIAHILALFTDRHTPSSSPALPGQSVEILDSARRPRDPAHGEIEKPSPGLETLLRSAGIRTCSSSATLHCSLSDTITSKPPCRTSIHGFPRYWQQNGYGNGVGVCRPWI